MIKFFAKDSLQLNKYWHSTTNIIKKNILSLKALEIAIEYLPTKILYYLHSKTQAFLHSCIEVASFDKVQFYLLK